MQTLYRAFRPDTFDKVVGQDPIVHILKHQVASGTVGHAYLFHGSRGTGKTSCAKILARAVNCLNPQDGNPCNECAHCRAILDEATMDFTEMDAASNRRIDDIRDLREKVKYLPSDLPKKVIIIDEAHMITMEGFNALLKTLEEPPAHLLFILATTELEKIPPTIASRCQIYSFRRIGAKELADHLAYVTEAVGREADPDALESIAWDADGAVRDALGALDQVLAGTAGRVTSADVERVSGRLSLRALFDITDAVFDGDMGRALAAVEDVRDAGKEAASILEDLAEHFRKLMLARITTDRRLFTGTDEQAQLYTQRAEALSEDTLLRGLETLLDAQSDLRFTNDAHTLLITAVLRLCRLAKEKELTERVAELEAYLFNGGKPAPPVQRAEPKREPPAAVPKVEAAQPENAPPKTEAPVTAASTKTQAEESVPEQKAMPEEAETPPPTEPSTSDDVKTMDANGWRSVLENIRRRNVMLYAWLVEGTFQQADAEQVRIVFPDAYEIHKNNVDKEENRRLIEEELTRYASAPQRVQFVLEKELKRKEAAPLEEVLEFFQGENIEIKPQE